LGHKNGIDCSQGCIESIKVNHGATWQSVDSGEIPRTEIDVGLSFVGGHYGESVGAADKGTDIVQKAEAVLLKGTLIVGHAGFDLSANTVNFILGKCFQVVCNGGSFHRKDGEVFTAGVAARSADDIIKKIGGDVATQSINSRYELPVIVQTVHLRFHVIEHNRCLAGRSRGNAAQNSLPEVL
jgi:hypothetical protein